MNPLIDLLKYFGQYPSKTAVLKLFSRTNTADEQAGYQLLKTWAESLPETSIMPTVNTFIFSTDGEKLIDMIKTVKGYFMLFEYGNINITAPDRTKNREREWRMAITFGYPQNKAGQDLMSEAIIMDSLYALAFQLQQQIATDNKELCGWIKMMDGSLTINPVEPKLLFENYGVVVDFTNKIYY